VVAEILEYINLQQLFPAVNVTFTAIFFPALSDNNKVNYAGLQLS